MYMSVYMGIYLLTNQNLVKGLREYVNGPEPDPLPLKKTSTHVRSVPEVCHHVYLFLEKI